MTGTLPIQATAAHPGASARHAQQYLQESGYRIESVPAEYNEGREHVRFWTQES
jgi:hypothetical protein